MFKRVFALLLALGFFLPIVATKAASPLSSAVSYLQNNYSAQAAGNQDWAAIALGENGVSVPVSSADTSSLLAVERNALARAAQGVDGNSIASRIEAAYSAGQIGSPSLINDDIFGALALQATDPNWLTSHQEIFTTIANSQRSDGSFGFSTSGNGDADITAAAVWALKIAQEAPTTAINNAAAFLKNCQNSDGGYGVLPNQTSSVATSGWAMIAQNTLGNDTTNVRNYLFGQEQNGGFWLQGSSANYLNTAYAVMALGGQKLPYKKPAAANPPPDSGHSTPNSNGGNNQPTGQPSVNNPSGATPKSSSPSTNNSTSAAPTAKPVVKKAAHRITRTTTTTYQTFSCSASAYASATGDNAYASASASCN